MVYDNNKGGDKDKEEDIWSYHTERLFQDVLEHISRAIRSELVDDEEINEPEDYVELAALMQRLIDDGYFAFSKAIEGLVVHFTIHKDYVQRLFEEVRKIIKEEKKKILLIRKIEMLFYVRKYYKAVIIIEKPKDIMMIVDWEMLRYALIHEPKEAIEAIFETLREIEENNIRELRKKVDYSICGRIRRRVEADNKDIICFKAYESKDKAYYVAVVPSPERTSYPFY